MTVDHVRPELAKERGEPGDLPHVNSLPSGGVEDGDPFGSQRVSERPFIIETRNGTGDAVAMFKGDFKDQAFHPGPREGVQDVKDADRSVRIIRHGADHGHVTSLRQYNFYREAPRR